MTRNNSIKSLSLVTGTALALSVAGSSAFAGQANPFGMTELSQGYSVAAAEAKCGEGKCGGSMKKVAETKCGGSQAKETEEAKCGGSKAKATEEAKCGGSKPKAAESKCGGNKKAAETKCGGSN